MKLSQNFTLAELSKSQIATRAGVDNTPGIEEVENLRRLANNVLQAVRDKFGPTVVSSGYRSPLVNHMTGGSDTSDHMGGYAADIEVPGVSNLELAKWIRDKLKFKQLILEFHDPNVPDSGWVHVSYDEENLKQEVLRAVKQNGKTVYLKGLTPV